MIANRVELAKQFSGVGVELGVARGVYSEAILREGKVSRLWSIDRWSDHHDLHEYFHAAKRLARIGRGRSSVLRCTFDEALPLFADASLDFVYVDGYAHTGQESGHTLCSWWPKVKPGGIMAGHDFHPKYQATVDAVQAFCRENRLSLNLTCAHMENSDEYRSWWVVKGR
jgi:hypothetical protein